MTLEFFKSIIFDGITGSVKSVLTIAKVVIPIMVMIEALRAYNVLDWLSKRTERVINILGLSGAAAVPLMVGMFFGIVNGAAVMLQCVREGEIGKKDQYLLVFFLITCHSVIEDTVIFSAIGANGLLLICIRIIVAILITVVLSRRLNMGNISENQLQQ